MNILTRLWEQTAVKKPLFLSDRVRSILTVLITLLTLFYALVWLSNLGVWNPIISIVTSLAVVPLLLIYRWVENTEEEWVASEIRHLSGLLKLGAYKKAKKILVNDVVYALEHTAKRCGGTLEEKYLRLINGYLRWFVFPVIDDGKEQKITGSVIPLLDSLEKTIRRGNRYTDALEEFEKLDKAFLISLGLDLFPLYGHYYEIVSGRLHQIINTTLQERLELFSQSERQNTKDVIREIARGFRAWVGRNREVKLGLLWLVMLCAALLAYWVAAQLGIGNFQLPSFLSS